MAFALSPSYIEKIHDEIVLIRFPGSQPVGTGRDRRKIESAAYRPFQTAFQQDIFPSLNEKAAALFHGIIADHVFENGCKRAGVIAADLFLTANHKFLSLSQKEMYELAIETASHNQRNISNEQILKHIEQKFSAATTTLWSLFGHGYFSLAYDALQAAKGVRNDPLNRIQPGQEP